MLGGYDQGLGGLAHGPDVEVKREIRDSLKTFSLNNKKEGRGYCTIWGRLREKHLTDGDAVEQVGCLHVIFRGQVQGQR